MFAIVTLFLTFPIFYCFYLKYKLNYLWFENYKNITALMYECKIHDNKELYKECEVYLKEYYPESNLDLFKLK